MHPVVYSAEYEGEGRSRLTAFFRLLIVIPWMIWIALWGIAAYVAVVVAWFALLFTGRYPQGLYDFNAKFLRYAGRLYGFTFLLTDEFPSFGGEPDSDYPVRVGIAPPKAEYSRVKVFFRIILMIPVYVLAYIMGLISQLIGLIAWIMIVVTAKLPEGLYKPLRAALSYQVKAYAFYMLLTEDFPPFWMDQDEEAAHLAAGSEPNAGDITSGGSHTVTT